VDQLEPWLQQLGALGCRHLVQSGILPEIPVPSPEPTCHHRFVQRGKNWLLEFDGYVVPMSDSRGMKYLAQLLRQPGLEIHVLDLERAVEGGLDPAARIDHRAVSDVLEELSTASVGIGDSWPVFDDQARKAYQQRISELEEEIEAAEEMGNADQAEALRSEKGAILDHLKAATGLGGRVREWGSAAEKARSNITQAIKRALKEVEAVHPALAAHLKSVSTGYYCSYKPLGDPPAWEF